jgi:hypothetical protein
MKNLLRVVLLLWVCFGFWACSGLHTAFLSVAMPVAILFALLTLLGYGMLLTTAFIGDFIFVVLGTPLAPVVRWALGSSGRRPVLPLSILVFSAAVLAHLQLSIVFWIIDFFVYVLLVSDVNRCEGAKSPVIVSRAPYIGGWMGSVLSLLLALAFFYFVSGPTGSYHAEWGGTHEQDVSPKTKEILGGGGHF